jgi:hypothetical protein
MIAALSALASLVLVLVLPGLAGGLVLSGSLPDTPADPAADDAPVAAPHVVLSRGVACGVAAWLLGSGLVTRTVGLTTASAWVWDALVAVVSLVVILLPRNRSRLRAALGPAGRRLAEAGALAALVFVPLGYTIIHTSWSPLGSTPWYYYGLARQVADVGSIPATSIEFGTTTPFLNDYHLFTTGTAMLLVQSPDGPITVIAIVTLIGLLLLAIGTVAFTSALGAGRVAALLAVPVAVATGIAPTRLAAYRPEGFALGLTLLVATLSIDWLRNRDRRSLVAAALLAATLSQVHGIAALTSGVMVTAAALASLIRGPRVEQLRRTGIALAVLLAAVAVTGLAFREASGTAHLGGLVDRGGLADPTWEFFRAARGEAPSGPPSNGGMVLDTVRQLYSSSRWWIVPVVLLASLGLWRRRRDAAARQVVDVTALSLLGLVAVACVFMFGWQGYVPRRTGGSRILLEASLLVPPFVAIGLECLAREAWQWRGRRLLPTRRHRAPVMLAALTILGIVSMVGTARFDNSQAPTRAELALWRSLPMSSNDVVLANGYTEGFIPDVTGAQGLLDGRAPYTFDAQLHRANRLLRGGQAFFTDPAAHWSFLADNKVSWVVVGDPDGESLGTGNVWDTPRSLQGLESCVGLERVAWDTALTAFRVVDSGPQGC